MDVGNFFGQTKKENNHETYCIYRSSTLTYPEGLVNV